MAAARIDQYTAGTSPITALSSPTPPHMAIPDASRGVQELGQGLERLGQGAQVYENEQTRLLREQETQAALTDANARRAQTQTDWTQTIENSKNAVLEAGQDNGPGMLTTFVPDTLKAYGDYSQKQVAAITNPVAKAHLQRELDSYGAHVAGQAMSFVAHQQVEYRFGALQKGIDAGTQAVEIDPSQYDLTRQANDSAIEASAIPTEAKDRLKKAGLSMISEAATRALVRRDPAAFLQAVAPERAPPQLPPPGATAPAVGGFDAAIGPLLNREGGYVANDAGKGPTRYGINSTANPDVNLNTLTPDGAKAIYKSRYWDAIGADRLAPAAQAIAFDAAVNQGVGYAKQLIADTGGDPQKMLDARRARYAELAQDGGMRKYQAGWNTRLDELQAGLDAAPAAPGDNVVAGPGGTVNGPPNRTAESSASSISAFNALTPQQQDAAINHAESLIRRGQMGQRITLENDVKNLKADADSLDRPVVPIPEARFQAAYADPAVAHEKYLESADVVNYGQAMRTLVGMPPNQMEQYLATIRPSSPTDPDRARKDQLYKATATAAANLQKQRNLDVRLSLSAEGVAPIQPIDVEKDLPSQLGARQDAAVQTAGVYTDKFSPFTAGEAGAISKMFSGPNAMTPDQQLKFLGDMSKGFTDKRVFQAALDQIRPDSPVTSMVASQYNEGGALSYPRYFGLLAGREVSATDAARVALAGERLLNPTKPDKTEDGKPGKGFPMPADSLLRVNFNNAVGDAFAGNAAGLNNAWQYYRAYYAGKAAQLGKIDPSSVDNDIANEAADAATGGISIFNGHSVPRPWGMSDSEFNAKAHVAYDAAAATAGYKLPDLRWNMGLVPVQGPGNRYYVTAQNGATVLDLRGAPIVLNLTPQAGANMASQVPR